LQKLNPMNEEIAHGVGSNRMKMHLLHYSQHNKIAVAEDVPQLCVKAVEVASREDVIYPSPS
jgi:hypothetical protein